MKKFITIGLIAIISLTTLGGCFNGKKEKSINIYTAIEEEYVEKYIEEFNKDYPDINVNIIRDSSGVVAAKLLVEKDNPRADIVWGVPASNALILDKHNMFYPYKSERLDKIDPNFYDVKNEIPHWVGISAWMTAFTVNVTELEKLGLPMPKSYKDLLNPAYKGEIMMPNPASSGTGFLTVSGWLQIFGEEKGWEYMDALNKNMKEYSHSGSAPTKQAAQGEVLIGVGMDFLSMQMEKKNKNIKTIMPEEGSGWEIEVLALINKKNIKDEAKVFYEWALSDKMMKMYKENRSLVTLKGSTDEKTKKQMIENNFNWASENRNYVLKKWEEKYGAGE
ncbi:MAG: putative 2-aminoethylphosphonate ABC transporter substrate-binding protein [Clostridium sp.]